jgi:hypothetical protein
MRRRQRQQRRKRRKQRGGEQPGSGGAGRGARRAAPGVAGRLWGAGQRGARVLAPGGGGGRPLEEGWEEPQLDNQGEGGCSRLTPSTPPSLCSPPQVHPYGGGPPVRAVAFATPPSRRTAPGLPPPGRYLDLLRSGAAHWGLEPSYRAWLEAHPSVDPAARGPEYYTSPAGGPLEAWPKIRTGGQQARRGGGGGRGGSGRGGRKHGGEQRRDGSGGGGSE